LLGFSYSGLDFGRHHDSIAIDLNRDIVPRRLKGVLILALISGSRAIVLAACLLISDGAFAQQQAPQQPSPMEQALGRKLMQEINTSVTCGAGLVAAQEQLTAAQVRVKALEDKYEPKKSPK